MNVTPASAWTFAKGLTRKRFRKHYQEKRTICGIYTCEKNHDRAQAVEETWFKNMQKSCLTLFVESDKGKPARIEGNTLYLDCPDGYEYLPVKTYYFVKYCLEHFDFEYIFKTDDDTYINATAFEQFPKTGDYIGTFVAGNDDDIDRTYHYGKFQNSHLEKPYSGKFIAGWAKGGDGYFLSRKAANELVGIATDIIRSELIEPAYCGFEDKMVGDVLSKQAELVRQYASDGSFGAIHPVSPSVMRAIHAQFVGAS